MVGDGALGLWRALREVFPATREQKCWVHKVRNVLNALPKSVHAGARKALNEIIMAEDLEHARAAIEAFASDYGVKWPKAVAKVTDDQDALLTFFEYPAEHCIIFAPPTPSLSRALGADEAMTTAFAWRTWPRRSEGGASARASLPLLLRDHPACVAWWTGFR